MALYQMECECGEQAEVSCPIADFPPKSDCPKCSKPMKHVITPPSIRAYYSPLHPRHRRGQGGILKEYGSQ